MNDKAFVDVDYSDDPWEVDESPGAVAAKVEAARLEGKLLVELVEDGASGTRIFLALDAIRAIYAPEDAEDTRGVRDRDE